MPGHVDRPAGERGEQRDILRRLVRSPRACRVVGRTRADEHRADILVAEVELDLLVRPLDEKRRVRVDDGSKAFERKPGGDADHQLLADADVEDTRMPRQLRDADLGEHERDARVLVERLRRHAVEALAHAHRTISATTQRGCAATTASASSSASWSRPSTRAALQPSSSKRRSTPPGQPYVDE